MHSVQGEGFNFFFTLWLEKARDEESEEDDSVTTPATAPLVMPAPLGPAPAGSVEAVPAPVEGAGRAPRPAFGHGQRLLVVEDNLINQEIIAELLSGYDLDVTLAGNGQEALELVAANAYDLVLMDLQMPVMDGLTATRRIRSMQGERFATMPIVALTANALPKIARIANRRG